MDRPPLSPPLSVVIPTLDPGPRLGQALNALRREDPDLEVVVSDGGSTALPEVAGAMVVSGPRGRGIQLAAGANAASGRWLLFLHADTIPEPGWRQACERFMAGPGAEEGLAAYFCFKADDDRPAARRLERAVAWRARVLGLPYGDQGLLISRRFHDALGGYRPLPLMEDVDMVRRIGRAGLRPLEVAAVTDPARHRRDGYLRRSARNLGLLGLYFLGVPPGVLRRLYG